MTSVPAGPPQLPSLRVPAALGENDAAVLDTFVVPSYLAAYWELAERLLLVGEAARVVHLECLTGFPDSQLLGRMPNTTGVGIDSSTACVQLAASKLAAFGFEYRVGTSSASGLDGNSFSHALLLHPPGAPLERAALFAEMARLLYPGGQALIAFPTGPSFQEVLDLLAEYALKQDDVALTRALEQASLARPTVEKVSDELEAVGFSDIDFELADFALGFDSGRALLEDPSARLLILPQVLAWLGVEELGEPLRYVARAVDKYWSDERMDVTVRVAALSARV